MIRCSECNKEIDRVIVISTCWQSASLSDDPEDGGHILGFGPPEVGATETYTCPKCGSDIDSELIRE